MYFYEIVCYIILYHIPIFAAISKEDTMTDREIVLPIKGQRESSIRLYYSNSPQYDRPLIEHFHPEIEIQIMESGCGTYYYNGKTHTIQPHDVYFFRSNERHYVTNRTADANGRPSTSYGFYFMPEFIQHLDADVLGTKYMSVFSNQNLSFINHVPADSYAAKQIYNLSRDIVGEFEQQKPGYEAMIILHLITIIAIYIRYYSPDVIEKLQSQPKLSQSNLRSIQNAMTYIDEHFTSHLSLNEIAGVANMSPSYFSQIFKSLNGFSAWDYIISCRVTMAKQLLKETDHTVLDIAAKCGFNNSANFNRQFRKITSLSPTEYRQGV